MIDGKITQAHPLFDLYYHELLWLAHRIKAGCEAIFAETPKREQGHYIKVSVDVHDGIETICLAAARLKKLVEIPSGKSNDESQAAYLVHQLRARALQTVLDGVELEEILKPKVRNS